MIAAASTRAPLPSRHGEDLALALRMTHERSISSRPSRTLLVLLPVCAALSLAAPPANSAPQDPCRAEVVSCAAEALGVEFKVHDMQPGNGAVISFGVRLVVFWLDGDCEYRQVVIVTVNNFPQLQDIMHPLAANEWNAAGEVKREDYQAALASGALRELRAEPPELYTCMVEALPPCELPWGDIVIDPIPVDGGDLLLYSGLEPVENPEFCFSIDLERGPIVAPAPEVMVPFFFLREKDIPRFARLLNQR
jgi:hypothetical protein